MLTLQKLEPSRLEWQARWDKIGVGASNTPVTTLLLGKIDVMRTEGSHGRAELKRQSLNNPCMVSNTCEKWTLTPSHETSLKSCDDVGRIPNQLPPLIRRKERLQLTKGPFSNWLAGVRIMFFRRDPASLLSPELCRDFHDNIRDGNIDGMLELLEVEPVLVHARNGDRATALMVATTYPDTQRAVEMMKLLADRGARLGCHDNSRRQTLLYACRYNVDCFVVATLLQWNDQLGGTKFKWHDVDAGGKSALVLASGRGNTAVTMLLLDKVNIERYSKQNHPFRVLKAAIDSGSEQHALEVAQHRKIQNSIEDPEITRYKGSGAPHLAWTISSCTEAAVDLGMLELLQVLNQLNQRKVARAVWYKIHKLSEDGVDVSVTVPRVLLRIGMHFTSAWRWEQVRELCLVRYGCNHEELEGEFRLLASLPDDVLHRIVAFVVPTAFQHPWDFVEQWCDCTNVYKDWKCHWHDIYEATRSDYDRQFNYCGMGRV